MNEELNEDLRSTIIGTVRYGGFPLTTAGDINSDATAAADDAVKIAGSRRAISSSWH